MPLSHCTLVPENCRSAFCVNANTSRCSVDFFINVYTYPNPKPTPYSNADALNIVVQREKKDEILMCACAVSPGRKI